VKSRAPNATMTSSDTAADHQGPIQFSGFESTEYESFVPEVNS
jgi:hypothetical protein